MRLSAFATLTNHKPEGAPSKLCLGGVARTQTAPSFAIAPSPADAPAAEGSALKIAGAPVAPASRRLSCGRPRPHFPVQSHPGRSEGSAFPFRDPDQPQTRGCPIQALLGWGSTNPDRSQLRHRAKSSGRPSGRRIRSENSGCACSAGVSPAVVRASSPALSSAVSSWTERRIRVSFSRP